MYLIYAFRRTFLDVQLGVSNVPFHEHECFQSAFNGTAESVVQGTIVWFVVFYRDFNILSVTQLLLLN